MTCIEKPPRLLTNSFPVLLALGMIISPLLNAATTPLNDTGVDLCGNNAAIKLDCPEPSHPGQDADFGRDAQAKSGELKKIGAGHAGFDLTKLDQNGKSLPTTAKKWQCVQDNYTGLMWEVKASGNGLQQMVHSYSWYMSDTTLNGGAPGVKNGGKCADSRCDTEGYIEAINKLELCGHKDWRLPLLEELRSIVDYSRAFPAIDLNYFPNTRSDPYWAREIWVKRKGRDVYSINFGSGRGRYIHRDRAGVGIRLVRGGH